MNNSHGTALTLDDVSLVYPDGDGELTVLDGVRLDVDTGELVALVGPSGSGKSSLLAVAGLLLHPTRGTVHVGGTFEEIAATERARLVLDNMDLYVRTAGYWFSYLLLLVVYPLFLMVLWKLRFEE